MSTKEIWKDIPEYEGYYQVSNLGRVKSLSRLRFNNGGKFTSKEKILKAGTTDGYFCVALSKNAKQKTFRVHQLMAMAFLNHTPCGLNLVVNHINFDRKDNRIENLELVTARENANKKHIKSSSKYTGVCWDKSRSKWVSHITIDNKQKFLGYFNCELSASKAYQNKLKEIL